ncbi:MAG: glycerol-3-phosphate 1-O-acyltransferase PlsY [Candidatus Saelkia tenebricola]|nr:glycerol-3-phosphate 1-O-acyltransferase PlsY [Candidatus Saelkia tenebricola]
MKTILIVFCSYLIGSVPFAYIISKMLSRVDIRDEGSGNVGATNVLRVVGFFPGVAVLLLDILKGVLVIKIAQLFIGENFVYLVGLAVIVGHCWSPFLKFKGGKGVATTLGVLLAVEPGYLFYTVIVWLLVFLLFKIVSLASIVSVLFLPLALIFKGEVPWVLIFIALYSGIIIFRHKGNIVKLIRGEEQKIQFPRCSK